MGDLARSTSTAPLPLPMASGAGCGGNALTVERRHLGKHDRVVGGRSEWHQPRAGERPVTRPFEDVAARAPEGSHREGDAAAGTSGKFARWLTARPAGITGMQWAWTPAGAATAVSPWCWYEHQHSHL